jgi:hypothetical protein
MSLSSSPSEINNSQHLAQAPCKNNLIYFEKTKGENCFSPEFDLLQLIIRVSLNFDTAPKPRKFKRCLLDPSSPKLTDGRLKDQDKRVKLDLRKVKFRMQSHLTSSQSNNSQHLAQAFGGCHDR